MVATDFQGRQGVEEQSRTDMTHETSPFVVFDLDGTLVDSAPDLLAAMNVLLAENGRRSLELDDLRDMIGDGSAKTVTRAFTATGGVEGDIAVLTSRFLHIYRTSGIRHTVLYPGVKDVLADLRQLGFQFGLCTNKVVSATLDIVRHFALEATFPEQAIVGGDSFEFMKPHPMPLQELMSRFGWAPAQGLMVGDSANDMLAAQAAGLRPVWVSYGYGKAGDRCGAEMVVNHLRELPQAMSAAGLRAAPGVS